jgi:GNAT superfamily N-acetyltransferase
MPSLFAPYQPDLAGSPAVVRIEPLGEQHLDRCAQLAAEREGEPPQRWRESLARVLDDPDRQCWVALVDGQIAGYASVARLEPPACDPLTDAPHGWYLAGVVVDEASRRRGVGRALTAARLAWLASRTYRAWYIASSLNLASVDLHAGFGFRLAATGVRLPGLQVSGTALLHVADLAGRRPRTSP